MKKKELIKKDALIVGVIISNEQKRMIQGGSSATATIKVKVVATEERK